ncbi:MAG: hypothetical protein ABI678_10520 [Kofleriaceae bacterium]
MRRLVALLVCASFSACSFAFVHGPKPPPAPPADCTTSRTVPILDSVFTGFMALFAIYAAVSSESEYRSNFCDEFDSSCEAPGRSYTVATSLIAAAAGGAGMYYGYTRVAACRKVQPMVEAAPPMVAPVAPVAPIAPPRAETGSGSGSDLPIPAAGLPVPGG